MTTSEFLTECFKECKITKYELHKRTKAIETNLGTKVKLSISALGKYLNGHIEPNVYRFMVMCWAMKISDVQILYFISKYEKQTN